MLATLSRRLTGCPVLLKQNKLLPVKDKDDDKGMMIKVFL